MEVNFRYKGHSRYSDHLGWKLSLSLYRDALVYIFILIFKELMWSHVS